MRHPRRSIIIVLSVAAATALAAVGPTANAAPKPTSPTASNAPENVIVVLRDQLTGTPANRHDMSSRKARATSSQDSVLSKLTGAAPRNVKHFALGNAFSASVTSTQAAALAADPRVAAVVPDRKVEVEQPVSVGSNTTSKSTVTPQADANGPFATCPSDPSKPLIEPEALQSIRALTTDGSPYAQQLATGAGVKVAFIADSMDPNVPDFIRPDGSHVFVDYQDFSGAGPSAISDGREAFGDASSIAAQGTAVHDLSNFVNQAHPLPPGCNIRVVGVAPGASLVGLVFASNSSILQAIDYAVSTDHVDVLNESFGLNTYPDISTRNTLTLFNDAAVAAGVTVTVSSGDAGITNTIGSPPDPNVIQVAGTTDNRLYAQTSYAAANFSNGTWVSDNISALSSSGITQFGRTVDLAAPGEGNWAVCAPAYTGCRNFRSPPQPTDLQSFGGTSESAPLTAGVAALVIQAYRSKHHGNSPSPAVVKQIITGTAHDLGLPADEQGAGLLDARAATEAALTWPGGGSAPAGVKSNLVTSDDQMTLSGRPGTTQSGKVTVTNVGTKPLTVAAGTRGYTTVSSVQQSVPFNSTTLPTFVYYDGSTWVHKEVRFTVPAGAQRLFARMAFQATGPNDIIRMTLLDPSGKFVANSRPQGGTAPANYANVDVRNPVAGTWTAVLYSIAGATGYHAAPVIFQTDAQKATPVGQVSPATFTLAPGKSKNVRVSFRLPADSGDTDYAVTFASSDGHQTAVSAILRALIDTKSGGAYSGVITGGNARAVSPAQTFSYAFDVPKNKRDLDVSLTLASDPNNFVDVVLIDPNGELADVGSNLTFDQTGAITPRLNAQTFDANPLAGRWHLVVVVQNPVSGREISQAFSGAVTFNGLQTQASGLPTSAKKVLKAGQPVQATVLVRNTGVQPLAIGADPRTNKVQTLQPVPLQGSLTFPLPDNAGRAPAYILPPQTSQFTVAASSTVPAQVEIQEGTSAGADLFGDLQAAKQGSSVSVASISEKNGFVTQGLWFTTVSQIGPFTDAGPPAGQTTITASMRTFGFDSAVSTSTDDPYQSPDLFGTPILVGPGEVGAITVTITPQGKKGSVVAGHLNLVTPPLLPTGIPTGLPQATTGAVISSLPYEYTIG
ncbi:MAG TPA: S8 family serine peptidase [Jatrophihabitantaceae bacterium]